jgi:hypothetical protein
MRTAIQKGRHAANKSKIRRVLEEKIVKQSNAWLYFRTIDRQLISEAGTFL